jgi:AcrR family transcriptional regulator
VVPAKRLARAQRREDLLDADGQLILSGGVEAVSMETVADRAGVSRPLVYKHFASKNELLTGVYRREALTIYDEVAADVRAATKLPEMYRALVEPRFAPRVSTARLSRRSARQEPGI